MTEYRIVYLAHLSTYFPRYDHRTVITLALSILTFAIFPTWLPFERAPRADQDQSPIFGFYGPMKDILVDGKTAARVSQGIPFDVVVGDGGKSIAGTSFQMKISGTTKAFELDLLGLTYADRHLKGSAEVKNLTDESIQGVRLDIVGATETYRTKDDKGNEVLRKRAKPVSTPSPLFFGDFAIGVSNGQLALDASTIAFAPDTVSFDMHGIVSGEAYLSSLDLSQVAGDGQIDVDARGRIYVSDTLGKCVTRVDGNGENVTQLCMLPDQCKGMARNPMTGEFAANCQNSPPIYLFDGNGTQKGHLDDGVLDSWSDYQRFDAHGVLWSNVGPAFWSFDANHKPTLKVTQFGAVYSTEDRFDVAPDGTLYAVTNDDTVLVRHPKGDGGVFAKGNGDKLGQLFGAKSVRVAPDGSVFVVEVGANNSLVATITSFSPSGSVIRAFD